MTDKYVRVGMSLKMLGWFPLEEKKEGKKIWQSGNTVGPAMREEEEEGSKYVCCTLSGRA